MNPQATAGRVVHYCDAEGPRAAIVNRDTRVDGFAELTVFDLGGPSVRNVSYSEEPAPGCWSWMPSGVPDLLRGSAASKAVAAEAASE